MTKEEIEKKEKLKEILPEYIWNSFNEVDWEMGIKLLTDENIKKWSSLVPEQWEIYRNNTKKCTPASIMAVYRRFPLGTKALEDFDNDTKLLFETWRKEVDGSLRIEEFRDGFIYVFSILDTAPYLQGVDISKRSLLEHNLIAVYTLEKFRDLDNYKDTHLKAWGEMLLSSILRANSTYVTLLIGYWRHWCDYIYLVFIAHVLSEATSIEKDKGKDSNQDWWRAVYRALHDYRLPIARSEYSFICYMYDNIDKWSRIARIFNVNEGLSKQDLWIRKNATESEPLPKSATPLTTGNKNRKNYYSETPWINWKDDYANLLFEKGGTEKYEEERNKIFGDEKKCNTMLFIAQKLTNYLKIVIPHQ